MELTEEVKGLLVKTAKDLKGSVRRALMARTVEALGEGGQRLAERELGGNRGTIRKGMREVKAGIVCEDGFALRGRKRSEEHLPNLLSDISAVVDSQSQPDPAFRTTRLYTRLTAAQVRRPLIEKFGYSDEQLPTAETIGSKLNELGYYPQKVAKSQPQKNARKPQPSLLRGKSPTRKLIAMSTPCGSRWRQRRASKLAPLLEEAKVVFPPRLLTMPLSQWRR